MHQITPNFFLEEFIPDFCEVKLSPGLHILDTTDGASYYSQVGELQCLANRLQVLRDYYGPIKINSGFRTWRHHVEIYQRLGKPAPRNSQHLLGKAADIVLLGLEQSTGPRWVEVFDYVWGNKWSGGLGLYNWGVHLDIRPDKARWDFR